jgi:di/tricarboxylate transporter
MRCTISLLTEINVPRVLNSFGAQQISFLVILLVAFALLLTERLRNDIVAVLVILALSISGVLKPAEALAGFGSEPAIVVAAIFVLSGALHRTGLSELIGRCHWLGARAQAPAKAIWRSAA